MKYIIVLGALFLLTGCSNGNGRYAPMDRLGIVDTKEGVIYMTYELLHYDNKKDEVTVFDLKNRTKETIKLTDKSIR